MNLAIGNLRSVYEFNKIFLRLSLVIIGANIVIITTL